jgi:hypothetical protein
MGHLRYFALIAIVMMPTGLFRGAGQSRRGIWPRLHCRSTRVRIRILRLLPVRVRTLWLLWT